jgi:hypothetical protein
LATRAQPRTAARAPGGCRPPGSARSARFAGKPTISSPGRSGPRAVRVVGRRPRRPCMAFIAPRAVLAGSCASQRCRTPARGTNTSVPDDQVPETSPACMMAEVDRTLFCSTVPPDQQDGVIDRVTPPARFSLTVHPLLQRVPRTRDLRVPKPAGCGTARCPDRGRFTNPPSCSRLVERSGVLVVRPHLQLSHKGIGGCRLRTRASIERSAF